MKQPRIVHILSAAPAFSGRETELQRLRDFCRSDQGVCSLVGIGGAGKTAVLDRFLAESIEGSRFAGVLVWSFYDDPDTNAFLKSAVEYVTGVAHEETNGSGWFHALRQILDSDTPYLFVLDGLERVQRTHTNSQGIFGELEDPLLRGLLIRLVSSNRSSKAIITSRFPVSDLDRWRGSGHEVIDIDQLEEATAVSILRDRGVSGEPSELRDLLGRFGRHALTVDLLGTATKLFFGGNALKVPVWEAPPGEQATDPSVRLAAVLNIFHGQMSVEMFDLMCRICVFRFGVSADALSSIFLNTGAASGSLSDESPEQLAAYLVWLTQTHLIHLESDGKFTVHPAVRDHFYRLFRDAAVIHGAVSEHLLSLTERPGVGYPTAKEALDLLEELIYHALHAGQEAEAVQMYLHRLGGHEHLNSTLGEYARTYRILASFPTFVDHGAMYSCLRAFGHVEEALKWRAQNRYLRIATGSLRELREDPSETTRSVARFLLGESQRVPTRMADFPIPAAHLHLLAGSDLEAKTSAEHESSVALFQDDVIRCQLALGEVARRRGDFKTARSYLDRAGQWALRSGSHEHLCLLFLYRGRLDAAMEEYSSALTSLREAEQIAEESDFRLIAVEIAVEIARVLSHLDRPEEAAESARAAVQAAASIHFPWGEILALRCEAEVAQANDEQELANQARERARLIQLSLSESGRP